MVARQGRAWRTVCLDVSRACIVIFDARVDQPVAFSQRRDTAAHSRDLTNSQRRRHLRHPPATGSQLAHRLLSLFRNHARLAES
jgi:hypothetical protein